METSTKTMHAPMPRGDRHEIDKAYAEAHERIRNAAPDLLAACERIVKMLSTLKDPTADERAAISIARAVLAKYAPDAEGGAE